MEILVLELTGPALDWAAARADGWCPAPNYFNIPTFIKGLDRRYQHQFKYSTDWSQGGPIIEQEKIETYYQPALGQWAARCADSLRYGPTPLIAAMRSFVAHRIGDVVDVPDELLAQS